MNDWPDEIRLSADKQTLSFIWQDKKVDVSAELLRVCSPSADVRTHEGNWQVPLNKQAVRIDSIQPVGDYALRLVFSDGHSSGAYSWDVLADLIEHQDLYWQHYQRCCTQGSAQ